MCSMLTFLQSIIVLIAMGIIPRLGCLKKFFDALCLRRGISLELIWLEKKLEICIIENDSHFQLYGI